MKSTVPPFEQLVATLSGFLCAGPLGALAAWGSIRALKGNWIPWLVLGFSTTPFLILVQMIIAANILSITSPAIIIEQEKQEMLHFDKSPPIFLS